ncbi:orotate phosphoribosyltransferase [Elusimicrobium minutum]|uniref:orotate phosphoribosyltransferase n=1 Tax=Elusimicrobium minutum TaxID=423605 RepID=UPI001650421D
MEKEEVLSVFKEKGALLEGHFKLSSGLHSAKYLQCAKVLQYPETAERFCKQLAAELKTKGVKVDVVVGPAMGGVIIAYELARQLGVRSVFTERVDGKVLLRRGFEINKGENCVIAEDVVTTGKSTKEVIDVLKEHGANLTACASLIDRSGGEASFGVPFVNMAQVEVETFEQFACPMCKQNILVEKPGSRKEI